jgi:hypothetical protein
LAKGKLKLATRNVNENVGVLHQLLCPLLAGFVVLFLLCIVLTENRKQRWEGSDSRRGDLEVQVRSYGEK